MKIRVGVIGCGYWGPNLIRNFVEISESEVCAAADLSQERLDHIGRLYPSIGLLTRNYEELHDLGLDAVVIATPPDSHFRLAREFLNKDHHVLVEKPFTTSSGEAAVLLELAGRKERVLMVGHTFEYNPAVVKLKELVESGELGEIYYIDAVRASLGLFQTSVNVLWDLAPHDVSILRYVLGTDPVSVSACGTECVQAGIEDVAYATLAFPGKLIAHIRTSWLDPCKTRRITVVGSKKMVIYDDVDSIEKIKLYDKGVQAIRRTETFGEFQFAYHYGDVTIPYIRFEEPLRVECNHFLSCIRDGTTPLTDSYDGLRVVQIVEAAHQSMSNGSAWIDIAPASPVRLGRRQGQKLAPVG